MTKRPNHYTRKLTLEEAVAANFAKGETVHVINCTLNGKYIVEGEASIVYAIDYRDSLYVVDFGDGRSVERFVDPDAQLDPAAFVDRLNEPQTHGRETA